ncbi:MAG: SAM-dependent chlorinase/fluorinase [Desulfobacterales bacterium]|jgi:S-adenosylmethionine hydrolase
MPIITILSDFGVDDEYVAVMKGVILSICPSVSIVDISHQIDPQDIAQAAYLIPVTYRFYPKGTVHLIVVDPGVGSQRDILALDHAGHVFIAPDNGVLTLLMNQEKSDTIVRIHNTDYFLKPVSATFHGRDIFAPIGAHIVNGTGLENLGTEIDIGDIVHLEDLNCRLSENGELVGKIISIDRFGNLITNVDSDSLARLRQNDTENRLQIRINTHVISDLSDTYVSAAPGSPLALIGSRNYLEIAVNCGSAKQHFKAQKGDTVRVKIL